MPTKPKRLCGRNGCPGLWDGHRCTICDRKPDDRKSGWVSDRRGSRHERGYDSKWVKLRARKIKADPFCERCMRHGFTEEAKIVDHIRSFHGTRDPLRLSITNHSAHDVTTRKQTGKAWQHSTSESSSAGRPVRVSQPICGLTPGPATCNGIGIGSRPLLLACPCSNVPMPSLVCSWGGQKTSLNGSCENVQLAMSGSSDQTRQRPQR